MADDPNQRDSDRPEQPRVEPEILPPEHGERQSWPPSHGYSQSQYSQSHGAYRLYVTRIGPFGFALMMLIAGLLGAVFLLALIGTALIWIPLVVALVLAAFISRLFRR